MPVVRFGLGKRGKAEDRPLRVSINPGVTGPGFSSIVQPILFLQSVK